MTMDKVHDLRFHEVTLEFGGAVPEAAVRAAAGVEDVAVDGARLTCTVHSGFDGLLAALERPCGGRHGEQRAESRIAVPQLLQAVMSPRLLLRLQRIGLIAMAYFGIFYMLVNSAAFPIIAGKTHADQEAFGHSVTVLGATFDWLLPLPIRPDTARGIPAVARLRILRDRLRRLGHLQRVRRGAA